MGIGLLRLWFQQWVKADHVWHSELTKDEYRVVLQECRWLGVQPCPTVLYKLLLTACKYPNILVPLHKHTPFAKVYNEFCSLVDSQMAEFCTFCGKSEEVWG